MKAITYSEYGPPDVLTLSELPAPTPKDNELLIRVRAVEATKTDIELRRFKFGVKWFWLPMRLMWGITKPRRQILGGYFAGEIEGMGKDVEGYSLGSAVFGCTRMTRGTYAEFIALPANNTIVTMPKNMDFQAAAAVPLGGLNALHFMRRANIQPDESILINGAGGCIGAHAVQIARAMGAEVTAVDIGFKEEKLRHYGASHFIDYTQEDFTERPTRYDIIFDMVPNSSYSGCINTLKSGGRYLKGNCRFIDMIRSLFTGWFSDKSVTIAFAAETVEELTALKDLIEQGEIKSIVDKVYPMDQAAEAHRQVEAEQRVGAIVINMATQ